MAPVALLTSTYDYRLVAVSIFISLLTASAALDLAGRATNASGKARGVWLCCGSVAMGIGIWAMHYVGMQAFILPVPVLYDWPTVLLSLIAAILASGTALLLVTQQDLDFFKSVAGSIAMGSGIAAMHYIGMGAMRLPATCSYSPGMVVLSVVLGIVISFIALKLTFALSAGDTVWGVRRIGGAVAMGLAIPIMHYAGMAAVSFVPMSSMQGSVTHATSVSRLALVAIALAPVIMLCFVLLASMIDRRMAIQSRLLRDNELQIESFFQNMKEGVAVLDLNHRIVYINRAAAELFGLPSGTLDPEDFRDTFDIFLPDGQPIPREEWPTARALRGDFVGEIELQVVRRDSGRMAIVEVSTAGISNHSGAMNQVILTLRDITERRRLDNVRTRLAAIVESSGDSIISKDRNGVVTSWNRGSEKLFGYAEKEMLGQSIRKLIPNDRLNEEEEILARIHNAQTVDHFETERLRKDGTVVHVSLMISPILDASGAVVGASKIARDITDRVKLERQFRQSQKMEAVGQLSGGIAHDFNNLLGVVIGNLDLLERSCQGDETKLKRIRTAIKAAGRGADLTRRLLAFSSKDELRPSSTVLEESIQSMIELASRLLGAEIRVVTHFDKSLPPIQVDSSGLESALLNLVVNSRDAMPNGGVLTFSTARQRFDDDHPGVQSGEIYPGDFIRISVTDTGTGMTREQLDRAFEPFFTTKPQGRGTGLGLAMVYGFAKQSGGLARIYSEVGQGTTVSLYLPFAKGISKSSVKKNLVQGAPADSSYKVLVVDDESDLLEIALCYLKELGYHGLKAKDAISALAIVLDRRDIDILVTDISMPGGMNGVELAAEARRISPDIKVVYCSGFPAESLAERSKSPTDGPLLHKPYQRSEFAAMIRHVLEGSLPA